MTRLAFLLTGSIETAHDLVQDSFVRVHGRWDRIAEPRAYLRRTVVNACRSHHRRLRATAILGHPRVEDVDLGADEMIDAIAALPYRQRRHHPAVLARQQPGRDRSRPRLPARHCRVAHLPGPG